MLGYAILLLSARTIKLYYNISRHAVLYYIITSCCYWLGQLTRILAPRTLEAKCLVHALISSHLDYCNSLQFDVQEKLLRTLQSVRIEGAGFKLDDAGTFDGIGLNPALIGR